MQIDINGLKINYEIFGEGEPLLLLHGWMANIQAMAPIYTYFSKTRKVFALDFPSQGGKSDELTEAWGVPEYSEMVYEFIKKLGIENTDVMGHSFGGRVIIYLSAKYKDLFDKIILVDSAGIKSRKNIKNRIKVYTYKFMKSILKLITPKDKFDERLNRLRSKFASGDYSQLSSNIMRETFKKIINLDLTDRLQDIERPTLIMWGENDLDTPLYMAKIMEKKIKDSGLVILKNAGHYSYLDATQQFLKVAANFFGGK
jgi:pimeloyl-ACP methyl ester carboxylesterase